MPFKIIFLIFSITTSLSANERDLLERKKSQWQAQNINNYQYIVQKQCFCTPEFTQRLLVKVKNGQVDCVTNVDSGKRVSNKVFNQQYTILKWYELALESMKNRHGKVELEYDQELPYPSTIYIDQHKMRADDEFTVSISDLIY